VLDDPGGYTDRCAASRGDDGVCRAGGDDQLTDHTGEEQEKNQDTRKKYTNMY
jgi:hypothetical protein